jgi:hypothetical protein
MNNSSPESSRILAVRNPHLIDEWHSEKNGDVTPFDITYGSGKRFWWICKNGHEWISSAKQRSMGKGCFRCSWLKVDPSKTLAFKHPDIANEWHPEKNQAFLTPQTVYAMSSKKVWWRCAIGHEWRTAVGNRALGSGCPFCKGKLFTPERCLAIGFPHLSKEWNEKRNGDLTVFDVTSGSSNYVWWICNKGHEWRSRISVRAMGSGCPSCFRTKVKPNNSLSERFPDIAKYWHPTKNGELTPEMVNARGKRRVWWICDFGHAWEAVVGGRTVGWGCPYCAGRKVGKDNNLAVLVPSLAAQWHPSKNKAFKPDSVRPGSRKKAWWVCESGHEWKATIMNRSKGSGCPVCWSERRPYSLKA